MTHEVANKVVNQIRFASPYNQLVIESDDGTPPQVFDAQT
jgi:hypothetical protein